MIEITFRPQPMPRKLTELPGDDIAAIVSVAFQVDKIDGQPVTAESVGVNEHGVVTAIYNRR